MFRRIFITGEITTWGEVIGDPKVTEEIHVYTRSDACGAAEEWAKFLGGFQEDLLGIGVNADPGLLDAVLNDPLGIGYNNLGYAFDLESGWLSMVRLLCQLILMVTVLPDLMRSLRIRLQL